jgi:hypothetical protein
MAMLDKHDPAEVPLAVLAETLKSGKPNNGG